jgi:hypothetical protein
MARAIRRETGKRPTLLLTCFLAGAILAGTTAFRAYSSVLVGSDVQATATGSAGVVTRIDWGPVADNAPAPAKRPSVVSTFTDRWDVDTAAPAWSPSISKLAAAIPAAAARLAPASAVSPVAFAWADPSRDDVAIRRLLGNAAFSGWSDGAFPIAPGVAVAPDQQDCLAKALYFEARGEGRIGQLAVAQVILNRVKEPGFPSTICGVVYQNDSNRNRCQFSFACDGYADRVRDTDAWREAQAIARQALASPNGVVLADVGNSTHYHATSVMPSWAGKMNVVDVIGHHVFYTEGRS